MSTNWFYRTIIFLTTWCSLLALAKTDFNGQKYLHPTDFSHKKPMEKVKEARANQFEKDISEIFNSKLEVKETPDVNPLLASNASTESISPVVKNAITREIEKKNINKKKWLKKSQAKTQRFSNYPKSNITKMPLPAETFLRPIFKKDFNSEVILRAAGIYLNNNKIEKNLKDYELSYLYLFNDYNSDNGSGNILIQRNLNQSATLVPVKIIKKNFLRTSLLLPVEKGTPPDINVPLFEVQNFVDFLEKKKIEALGSNLFINLSDEVRNVSIDHEFEKVFYFNKNLKEVKENDKNQIQFVLYVGVTAGNTLINYELKNNLFCNKIVHLVEDEVFYDENIFSSLNNNIFELYEGHLLGNKQAEKTISSNEIIYFTGNNEIKKNGAPNRFEILRGQLSLGQRHYLEFKHGFDGLFLGRGSEQSKIELPGENYIDQIFQALKIENLEGQCLVQINLSKKPLSIDLNYQGILDANINSYYLSDDGLLKNDLNTKTVKIFIKGQNQSAINLRLLYSSGEEDIFQSYCAPNTYLVEQL